MIAWQAQASLDAFVHVCSQKMDKEKVMCDERRSLTIIQGERPVNSTVILNNENSIPTSGHTTHPRER